ncbi:hypothetical protein KAU34_07610 [candidate division WOR-3 bacterium]|nr:hypothetical protein [candidate division WOR-3 bacterium]MCK4576258.1 hypothetical protein [candidate division WOR-3 bacterium]
MDEKLKILKMLEDGKISSEQANKLLEAIENKSNNIESKAKWLKVKVIEDGCQKVNIKIPLKVIRIAAKIGGKLNINLPEEAKEKLAEKGINLEKIDDVEKLNEILEEIEKEAPFELVNVDEGTKKVFVYIE